VSLLLFMHLVAVFVAVTTYTRPSDSQLLVHRLFAAYLRPLHLTPVRETYPFARYYLTLGAPDDVDFACTVDYTAADGTPGTYTIPQGGLTPPIRNRRYQALANAAGSLAAEEENDEFANELPRAIGGAILRRNRVEKGIVRLRAHYMPELEQMAQVEAGERGPLENFRNIYEADVFLSGDTVELLKKSTTLENAPVERSGGQRP
jgi:hypothetical protein